MTQDVPRASGPPRPPIRPTRCSTSSAKPYYDAYAGSRRARRALLASVYGRTGHAASFEVCAVAELEGDLAGVIAWFPVDEGDARARRFVALTAPRVPPWHWPHLLRHLRAAGDGLAPTRR